MQNKYMVLCAGLIILSSGVFGLKTANPGSIEISDEIAALAGVYRTDVIQSIEFDGNRHFKNHVLQQRIGIEVGDHLDSFLAEGGRLTLEEIHRKLGYAFVEVTLDYEKLLQGRLHYMINEGPRVQIRHIKFVGNKKMKGGTLRKVIKTEGRYWFFWPTYFKEGSIEQDVELLRDFYYSKGYLDYKIDIIPEFTANKRKVDLVFYINEGPKYHVARIMFSGNVEFVDEQLRKKLKFRSR